MKITENNIDYNYNISDIIEYLNINKNKYDYSYFYIDNSYIYYDQELINEDILEFLQKSWPLLILNKKNAFSMDLSHFNNGKIINNRKIACNGIIKYRFLSSFEKNIYNQVKNHI